MTVGFTYDPALKPLVEYVVDSVQIEFQGSRVVDSLWKACRNGS